MTLAKVRLIQKTVRGKKTATWYLDYGHGDVRSTGITDKKIAEQLRARREAELVLSSHGLPNPADHRRRLADYVKEYEAKLAAPGRNSDYVRQTITMIRKIIKTCSWRTATNIRAADVNNYAVTLLAFGQRRFAQLPPFVVQQHPTIRFASRRRLFDAGQRVGRQLALLRQPFRKSLDRRQMRMHGSGRMRLAETLVVSLD
jgi:hypothetical protein